MNDSPTEGDDPNLILTALMFLQVQLVHQERIAIAFAVEDHLRRLDRLSHQLPPILARALPRLRQQWRKYVLERSIRATAETVERARTPSAVILPFPVRGVRS